MNEVVTKIRVNEFNPTENFKWQEFVGYIEYCAPNFVRINLYAVSGKVKGYVHGQGPDLMASNDLKIQVKIPFDRIGNLVKNFQAFKKCRVINVLFEKNMDYLYFITSSKITDLDDSE